MRLSPGAAGHGTDGAGQASRSEAVRAERSGRSEAEARSVRSGAGLAWLVVGLAPAVLAVPSLASLAAALVPAAGAALIIGLARNNWMIQERR